MLGSPLLAGAVSSAELSARLVTTSSARQAPSPRPSTLSLSDVDKWGEDILPWIAICSALVCFAVYALGIQRYMLLMPKCVFEGFTVGVALSIGCGQIKSAFGLNTEKGHWLETLINNMRALPEAQWGSMVLFFPMAIALYILCNRVPKVPW